MNESVCLYIQCNMVRCQFRVYCILFERSDCCHILDGTTITRLGNNEYILQMLLSFDRSLLVTDFAFGTLDIVAIILLYKPIPF